MGVFIQFNGNLKISDFAFGFACIVIFSNIFSIILFKVRASPPSKRFPTLLPAACPRLVLELSPSNQSQPAGSHHSAGASLAGERCAC
jgi:hypothetical protein